MVLLETRRTFGPEISTSSIRLRSTSASPAPGAKDGGEDESARAHTEYATVAVASSAPMGAKEVTDEGAAGDGSVTGLPAGPLVSLGAARATGHEGAARTLAEQAQNARDGAQHLLEEMVTKFRKGRA